MGASGIWRTVFFVLGICLPFGLVGGQDLIVIDKTNMRQLDPDSYFSKEYSRINARRLHYGIPNEGAQRPAMLIGISLSGGGIRSNAFQMGVLSGLYAEKAGATNLLSRIDYLSSVSGGSWANAATWAWPDALSDLFDCLDLAAGDGRLNALRQKSECRDAVAMLRNTQDVELVSYPGSQRKERWKRDIEQSHLRRGCNVNFDSPIAAECAANFKTKPYPILNATHSAQSDDPGVDGFPFQATPDQVGTIVDVHSTLATGARGGGRTTGFFLELSNPKFKWVQRNWLHQEGYDGTELSLFAAQSSGLIKGGALHPILLSYDFSISSDGKDQTGGNIRKRYWLNDGGKSDNTGLLPLVERGVDVLIVSYIGKDNAPFSEYSVAEGQLAKLLGCKFGPIDKSENHPLAQSGDYACGDVASQPHKRVLHVNPWINNVGQFLATLERQSQGDTDEAKGLGEIVDYLKTEDATLPISDRFPQTKTLETVYDERLVRAYYLLGKFAARNEIAPFLRQVAP